ncbi:DUF6975 family protein [Sphingomonas sp. FW199]|uniref:DUF6975 family protein n=1 Tax=Sphingomonas sp. FW199 TaxID=3400217 RepID=UPI003CE82893
MVAAQNEAVGALDAGLREHDDTMAQAAVHGFGNAWDALSALIEADGAHTHRFIGRASGSGFPERDLADIVHHLCVLHGRYPGLIDLAASHGDPAEAAQWAADAAGAFAAERGFLARLVSAVGPLPSTPGQAEAEAAVAAQRHALDMLGRSDRRGCALGAAVALSLDWPGLRLVMDNVANRLGVTPPRLALPERYETAAMVEQVAGSTPVERALLFGAQQLISQHRGLWDLLAARADARSRI